MSTPQIPQSSDNYKEKDRVGFLQGEVGLWIKLAIGLVTVATFLWNLVPGKPHPSAKEIADREQAERFRIAQAKNLEREIVDPVFRSNLIWQLSSQHSLQEIKYDRITTVAVGRSFYGFFPETKAQFALVIFAEAKYRNPDASSVVFSDAENGKEFATYREGAGFEMIKQTVYDTSNTVRWLISTNRN